MHLPVLALLLLIGFAPVVLALPLNGADAGTAEIRVRVPVDPQPPWLTLQGQAVEGIDARLITLMLSEIGMRPVFIRCPWLRCLRLMEDGQADLMSGLFKNPEREKYLRYLEPPYYVDPPKVFFTRKGSGPQIMHYGDLHDLTIGALAGALYFDRFDKDTALQKIVVNDIDQLVRLLKAGRIDTFVGTELHTGAIIRDLGESESFETTQLPENPPRFSYFAVSRRSEVPGLADNLEKILARLKDAGEIDRIIEQDLLEYESSKVRP